MKGNAGPVSLASRSPIAPVALVANPFELMFQAIRPWWESQLVLAQPGFLRDWRCNLACIECEARERQYLEMRRIAAELAKALERHERRFRLKPRKNLSVTELVSLVERRTVDP